MLDFNWYPGHMEKAKRDIKNELKIVDIVIEVIDARAPISSRSEFLNNINFNKPIIIALNRSDQANAAETKKWVLSFKNKNYECFHCNIYSDFRQKLIKSVNNIIKNKIKIWNSKKMFNRVPKLMVVGIPNIGKSTFVNKIIKRKKEKTENKAGVTRIVNWHSVCGLEICDTPGMLLPRLDKKIGRTLAFLGLIKENVFKNEELCVELIDFLKNFCPNSYFLLQIFKKYDNFHRELNFNIFENANENDNHEVDKILMNELLKLSSFEIIVLFAKIRKIICRGGVPDTFTASKIFLNEFQNSKFGNITLEQCI